jgi:hypothetical protein
MENKNNINDLVNIRLQTYSLQGLDLASQYARVCGELQALININERTNKDLENWINYSVTDARKNLQQVVKLAA